MYATFSFLFCSSSDNIPSSSSSCSSRNAFDLVPIPVTVNQNITGDRAEVNNDQK